MSPASAKYLSRRFINEITAFCGLIIFLYERERERESFTIEGVWCDRGLSASSAETVVIEAQWRLGN